jgi:hypothetical protein
VDIPALLSKLRGSVKQIRKRLTYANVMSSLAVFLILGGATAFAAKKIGGNQIRGNSISAAKIKKNAVTAAKIKKNAVTTGKIAPGAVANGKIAAGSVDVTKLAAGFVAPAAEKLTHAANISFEGVVLAGSLGIAQANVTHASTGFYCFSGLSPAPVGGVATIDYSQSGEDIEIQFATGQGKVCPAGTQAFVNTRAGTKVSKEPPTNPSVDAGFFVVLY